MQRLFLVALVLLFAGCSDHLATQYVGTVMSEAAPEAEGSLRLTLYSRTDTSFSGVIELGAPARGSGGAYAWHDGPELHLVSVGAETGDTIHWTSRLTEAALGGQFEVTGGEHAGRKGTWRAHLVQGPPATPATLRSRAPLPLPPLSTLWPILLLLVASVALGRWIRHAPRRAAPDGAPGPAPQSSLVGIGGWLVLFALGQVAVVLTWFSTFRSTWENYGPSLGIGTALFGMRPLLVFEIAMTALVLPLALFGLFLLVRHSAYAPRFWFAVLILNGVYRLVDAVAMSFIRPHLQQLVGVDALAGTGPGSTQRLVPQLLVVVMWILYWARSRRVRATFGAAALDHTIAPLEFAADVASQASPSTPGSGRRRWRRIALRSAGVILAVFLGLLTYGLWMTHVTPYSVADNADIRSTVAGRWTWVSDTAGCRRAHTIAFAESGKIMTITSADSSAKDNVTTYDVLSVSPSSIRGAIRGETRMTDDKKPVVWDLVLTSPEEYRWKRTDWTSTPWSYTGRIRRCREAQDVTAGAR